MKTKKILAYTSLMVIILIGAISCNDREGYSLGEFRVSIATVIPETDMSYYLLLDNGNKLRPSASDVYYKPHANQRVIVNYTILSDKLDQYDHYVKINDIWNILTKPIIELNKQNADSIGNDAVKVNDIWIGNHYLNASFAFNYNGFRPHAINMVQNMQVANTNDGALVLEFRHNSYNSPYNRLLDGFASFDLKPFRKEGMDSIPITIKVRGFNGDKEFKVMYRYNAPTTYNQIEAAIPNISSNEYE